MIPFALSDEIAVGEMPTAAEIAILAEAGFKSVLSSQPDGEVARFPTAAEFSAAATASGLAFGHVPVTSRRPPEADVAAFAAQLKALPKPIYACCYSGSRSSALWALAMAPFAPSADLVKACATAGYDISFLTAELDKLRPSAVAVAAPAITAASAAAEASPPSNGAVVANGAATNGSSATANADTKIASPVAVDTSPMAAALGAASLLASPILPRAASSGGFAVSG